jgi:hypothetical protein
MECKLYIATYSRNAVKPNPRDFFGPPDSVRSENILSAEMGRRLKIDGLEEAEERML